MTLTLWLLAGFSIGSFIVAHRFATVSRPFNNVDAVLVSAAALVLSVIGAVGFLTLLALRWFTTV